MNTAQQPPLFPHTQKGLVLVMVLVFLVVLSLLGVTTFEQATDHERLLRNTNNHQTALLASEDALSAGERWLIAQVSKPDAVASCDEAPCWVWQKDKVGDLVALSGTWWSEQGVISHTTSPLVAADAHYVLEESHFVPYELSPDALSLGKGYHYYQVTAHSVGRSTQASSILRSVYVVNFN